MLMSKALFSALHIVEQRSSSILILENNEENLALHIDYEIYSNYMKKKKYIQMRSVNYRALSSNFAILNFKKICEIKCKQNSI